MEHSGSPQMPLFESALHSHSETKCNCDVNASSSHPECFSRHGSEAITSLRRPLPDSFCSQSFTDAPRSIRQDDDGPARTIYSRTRVKITSPGTRAPRGSSNFTVDIHSDHYLLILAEQRGEFGPRKGKKRVLLFGVIRLG